MNSPQITRITQIQKQERTVPLFPICVIRVIRGELCFHYLLATVGA
jgi:hypothetical protein